MASKSGFAASVKFGTYTIAGMGTWTMDGVTRETIEDTAFGDSIKKYVFGFMDGGSLSFDGNYDPDDANGQAALNAACINASLLGPDSIKLYIDNTSYWGVGTSGNLLVTKANAVTMEKSGLGKISFSAKVSGAEMVLRS
jgi:hypothetical protein